VAEQAASLEPAAVPLPARSAPAAPALATRGLRKVFGDKVAVADLTLEVGPGEVFGFLGPNGAGKTTSIKMLLGLVAPTAGDGELLGAPLGDHRARARVGFLPEHFRFHDWLTGSEFLGLHADLYGMPRAVTRRRVPELLERVGLVPHAGKKLRTYSKGMLQRIGLAQALLNEPAVVILDEPTSGLDPIGRRLVRDIIADLSAAGTTVFLNSHLLSEVEITCHRVAFIKAGSVVRSGPLDRLVHAELEVRVRAEAVTEAVIAGLRQWCRAARQDGEELVLAVDHEDCLPRIVGYLVAQEVAVYAVEPRRRSLEELFLEIVGTDGGL
jgi:ABC-2 type transport system ATP-binding protein